MQDFARAAHAKQHAVDWYTRRAQEMRDVVATGVEYVTVVTDLNKREGAQRFDLTKTARMLMRAAASEQIPQALRDDG